MVTDCSDQAGDGPVASAWPRMRYGDLEDLLIELTGGAQESVVGRFRKLRLLPFPDAIRGGIGNRVEYDLPRVLAFCAVFGLNAMLIPQSHAVGMVRAVWPELVRGCLAAAVDLGLARRPGDMPAGLSNTVAILPDGFGLAAHPVATAVNVPGKFEGGLQTSAAAHIRIDCGMIVELIADRSDRSPDGHAEIARAFSDLDRAFGWTLGSVPHRAAAVEMLSGSSFLDAGPYLERAAAFLGIATTLPEAGGDAGPARGQSRLAAQNLLNYLGNPSPIDAWKGEIGTEEGKPRLKHLLAAVGRARGLRSDYPETFYAAAGVAPEVRARALVEKALRLEGAQREEAAAQTHGNPIHRTLCRA